MSRRRGLGIGGVAAGIALALSFVTPALAQATTCTYDPGTATLTVVAEADIVFAAPAEAGGAITVTGADCGEATVTNVDLIDVAVGSGNTVSIVQDFGRFEPGLTDEGDGTSEIEFQLSQGTDAPLIITGTEGDDAFAIAATHVALDVVDAVNLNADDDHDVLIDPGAVRGVILAGGDGADLFDLTGGGDAPTSLRVDVGGGTGSDIFRYAGLASGAGIFGEGGLDRLVLTDTAVDSEVVVDIRSESGTVGATTFEVFGIEHVTGHAGVDHLLGAKMTQFLFGKDGDDELLGRLGNDVLVGGPGGDLIQGGSGIDTCRTTPDDIVRGCENPPRQAERISLRRSFGQ